MIDSVFEARFWLEAESWALLAATLKFTAPLPDGVAWKVYTAPEPEKLLRAAFVALTLEASNPVTDELKVTVIGKGARFVGESRTEVRFTEGRVLLKVRLMDAALESLPAASLPAPAAIEALTVPFAEGVISKVYAAPEPTRLLAVPFTTLISASANPLTASAKTAFTVIGVAFVGSVSSELKVSVGPTLSKVRLNVAEAALPFVPAS